MIRRYQQRANDASGTTYFHDTESYTCLFNLYYMFSIAILDSLVMTAVEVYSMKEDFENIHMQPDPCKEWLAFSRPLMEAGDTSIEKLIMGEKLEWGISSR